MKKLMLLAATATALLVPLAAQSAGATTQPVRLDARNPHYFVFRGKTVAFITSGEHYGAVLNADVNYVRYLNTIQAAGLNYTRIFGGSYVEVPGKSFGIRRNDLAPAPGRFIAPWARSATPGYAGGGNTFDLSRWNPAYFQRFHDFLQQASARGIVVEITLFSSDYGDAQWALSPFNHANNINGTDAVARTALNTLNCGNILLYEEAYVRQLVREANPFDNVVFEIQNEPWADRPAPTDDIGPVNPYLQGAARDGFPNAAQLADAASLAWQARVADWITSEETQLPNRHLIAQSYANFRYPVRSLVPHVSIVNFHYAYPEAVTWNYGLDKAIAYDETGFLGHDDAAYRRQAWNFMLAGGSIFDALDYSFSPGHEDGLDRGANGPGGGSAALRQQLHILSAFLSAFNLETLRPDAKLVVAAPGTIPHVLSDPGQAYAVYLDGAGPTPVRVDLPAGQYRAQWVDVTDGATLRSELLRGGRSITLLSPAFTSGIALKIVRAGR